MYYKIVVTILLLYAITIFSFPAKLILTFEVIKLFLKNYVRKIQLNLSFLLISTSEKRLH